MKIAIVYDVWENTEEFPGAAKRTRGKKEKRPKLDREEITDALKKLGHESELVEVDGRDASLHALARTKADLYFNLTESFAGDDTKDMHLAAFLDLFGKKFTGSGPHGLYLAQDKVVAKKLMRFHGLHTPLFAVSYGGKLDHAQDVKFPLIVKPSSEDGSIGIDAGAVVSSVKELMERIHYIQEEFDSPALIEEFIEGREIYAAVIGNGKPEALPLVELDLSNLPGEMPKIAGFEVKFETETEAYKKTKSRVAEKIDEDLVEKIQETATTAYSVLKLRDYGRIDMRVTSDGTVYVIEANPNPWLASTAEFSMAARASGRTYVQTIGDIVDHAAARYE